MTSPYFSHNIPEEEGKANITCYSCRWWVKDADSHAGAERGWCHKDAPRVMSVPENKLDDVQYAGQVWSVWPRTDAEDFCSHAEQRRFKLAVEGQAK